MFEKIFKILLLALLVWYGFVLLNFTPGNNLSLLPDQPKVKRYKLIVTQKINQPILLDTITGDTWTFIYETENSFPTWASIDKI